LQIWLDPGDISTITSTGNLTDQIDDRSGNNNDAVGLLTGRPLTGTRTLNGHNVLDYDGIDDFLDFEKTTFGATSLDADAGEEFALHIIFEADDAGTLFARADSATEANKTIEAFISGTDMAVVARGTGNTITGSFTGGPFLFNLYSDGTLLTASFNDDAEDIVVKGSLVDLLVETLLLGARTGGTASFFDGAIGDFIVYDVNLTLAEKEHNVGFAMTKYGLAPIIGQSIGASGLQFWTDTSDAGTIDSSGGKVNEHFDKRGAPVSWTGSGGDRPNTGADTINGLNAFGFNNAGTDFMTSGLEALGTTGLFCDSLQKFTIFMVCAIIDAGTVISRCGATEANRTFQIFQEGGFLKINLRGSVTSLAAYVLEDPVVITITWDGIDAKAYIDNGAEIALTVGTASEETGEEIILGAIDGGASDNADSLIGEVAILDRIQSAPRRVASIAFLVNRWVP
jgi:hypothetical protein